MEEKETQTPDASRQALETMHEQLEVADSGEEWEEIASQAEEKPVVETGQEQTGEEQTLEEKPDKLDPEEHSERSRLGRRVARVERELFPKVDEMARQLNVLAQFAQLAMSQAQTVQQPDKEEEDDYIPTTKAEMKAWLMKEADKESKQTGQKIQAYRQGYFTCIDKLGEIEEDKSLHEEAKKLITTGGSPFNRFHGERHETSNPVYDAQINYNAAVAHLLKERAKKGPHERENPLKGKDPIGPLGTSSVSTGKAAMPVKLSSETSLFLRSVRNPKTGKPYTDEEIRKITAVK